MKTFSRLAVGLLILGGASIRPAQAQLYRDLGRQGATSRPEAARSQFIGSFRGVRSGDIYRFRSNGTYEFSGGRAAKRAGNIAQSGTWRILDYYEASSDSAPNMGTLQLRTTKSTVVKNRKRSVSRVQRTVQIPISLSMEDDVVFIRNQRFNAVR